MMPHLAVTLSSPPSPRRGQANRWRKRALSLVPLRYPVHLWAKYPALVSIYDLDGTVAVSVGGIEMGQGLNTKVCMTAKRFGFKAVLLVKVDGQGSVYKMVYF